MATRRRTRTAPAAEGATPRRGRLRERIARRPRVRLDNDARRAQLLELGMRIFAEKTYDEVSIDDLARAAGISKGLLYHYFPTKRDLYLTGLRQISAELLERTYVQHRLDLPPIERIRHGIDHYLSFVSERARPYVALMRGGIGSDPEVLGIIEDFRQQLVDRFFTGPASPFAVSEDRRTALARTALRGWLGFAEAASLDWLTHGDLSQVALRDLLVDMLLPTIRVALGFSLSRAW